MYRCSAAVILYIVFVKSSVHTRVKAGRLVHIYIYIYIYSIYSHTKCAPVFINLWIAMKFIVQFVQFYETKTIEET